MLDSRFVLWISLLLVLSLVGFSQARVINIPDDEETIQAGIDAAEDGDTVLVHPGRYVENINFEGKAIIVASLMLMTGEEAYIDSTVIDGDRNGRSVVVFNNGEDENSILTGFTIQNGLTDYGGGIYCDNSSPTLNHLTIRDNEVDHSGGGMYCTTNASPDISNILVSSNIASSDDMNVVNCGGGISFYNNCQPTLNEIVIVGNEAEIGGGLMFSNGSRATITNSSITRNSANAGGGIYDTGYARFQNVVISGNEAEYEGGGIWCHDVHFEDVSIIGNRADYGGGMMMSANYCTMIRVKIVNNEALQKGGGIYIDGLCEEQLIFTNLTFYGNLDVRQGDLAGGAIYCKNDYNNDINFCNCILWGDEPCEIAAEGYNIVISYSDMTEGRDGIRGVGRYSVEWLEGNIDENPLFADPDNGDFHLTEDSPCIDAGDPESPLDPDSTRADMGAYYYHHEVDVTPDLILHPSSFILYPAHPNPFNATTTIRYELPRPSHVSLSVHDLAGRLVETLVDERVDGGRYATSWQAGSLPSGLYFIRFEVNDRAQMQKVVLIR